jgi:uncharacterized protein (TIGR00251 family)
MDATDDRPYAPEKDGVRLAVRLTPRASRNGLDGVVQLPDGRRALQLRVAAPAVEGAANKALIGFVADALALRKALVTIRSGATSRLKILHLAGDSGTIVARLDAWLAEVDG